MNVVCWILIIYKSFMSIVFSAITPHPAVLIESIGKENSALLEKTKKSYQEIEKNLYASKAETIIIISPHGHIHTNAFTMNINPDFEVNFEEFGDFSTKINLSGDTGLVYKIREKLETKAPLQLMSEKNIDYGCGVPLYFLTRNLKAIKIIPIYYSGLDLGAHFKFGKLLKEELLITKNRFAIIASGDLSHRLSKDAPGGYSSQGAKFDKKIICYLRDKKIDKILNMNKKIINEAGECGLKSIIMLLGMLDGINYKPKILSYESPFGVGHLTVEFEL